ncbi:MAG: DNA methyltransferase, partial [Thermoplasmata archaeon]
MTSPPYWGLRDYGIAGQLGLEPDVGLYVERILEVFREARRVLREDGTLWLNLGDTHYTAKGACWNPGGTALSVHHRMKEAGAIPAGRSAPNRMLPRGRARVLGLKPGDLVMVPARVALAMQADGWILRSDVVWSKPNPMPESVTNRPTRSHEFLFLFVKRRGYFSAFDSIREPFSPATFDRL